MTYYKLFSPPEDKIHLPNGAKYTDYGKAITVNFGGFKIVGEVEVNRTLSTEECIHYGLEEKRK